MVERLTRIPRALEVESPGRPNVTVRHRFNICASSCVAMTRRWAPQTRYTLRPNTASVKKGLVFLLQLHKNLKTRQKNDLVPIREEEQLQNS